MNSLPLQFGGLNILMDSHSVLSTFAGSAAQSVTLQHQFMGITHLDEPSNWVSLVPYSLNVLFSSDKPVPLHDFRASRYPYQPFSEKTDSFLLRYLGQNVSQYFKTVINKATAEYSAVWKSTVHLPYLGLTLSPTGFRKALLYNTGYPLYAEPRNCTLCAHQKFSDDAGNHDAICPRGHLSISLA